MTSGTSRRRFLLGLGATVGGVLVPLRLRSQDNPEAPAPSPLFKMILRADDLLWIGFVREGAEVPLPRTIHLPGQFLLEPVLEPVEPPKAGIGFGGIVKIELDQRVDQDGELTKLIRQLEDADLSSVYLPLEAPNDGPGARFLNWGDVKRVRLRDLAPLKVPDRTGAVGARRWTAPLFQVRLGGLPRDGFGTAGLDPFLVFDASAVGASMDVTLRAPDGRISYLHRTSAGRTTYKFSDSKTPVFLAPFDFVNSRVVQVQERKVTEGIAWLHTNYTLRLGSPIAAKPDREGWVLDEVRTTVSSIPLAEDLGEALHGGKTLVSGGETWLAPERARPFAVPMIGTRDGSSIAFGVRLFAVWDQGPMEVGCAQTIELGGAQIDVENQRPAVLEGARFHTLKMPGASFKGTAAPVVPVTEYTAELSVLTRAGAEGGPPLALSRVTDHFRGVFMLVEQPRKIRAMAIKGSPVPGISMAIAGLARDRLLAGSLTRSGIEALKPNLTELLESVGDLKILRDLSLKRLLKPVLERIVRDPATLDKHLTVDVVRSSGQHTRITTRLVAPLDPRSIDLAKPFVKLAFRANSVFSFEQVMDLEGGTVRDVTSRFSLQPFDLDIDAGIEIRIPVERLSSVQRGKGAPTAELRLGPPDLSGVLKLFKPLFARIAGPRGGIDISRDANTLRMGVALPLPSVSLGAFSLSNLSLGISAWVPVGDGRRSVGFGLAVGSRERPFFLAVSALGGGGYFGIEVDTSGVRKLEISLEFGGLLSFDVAVASGYLSVSGGVLFLAERDGKNCLVPACTAFVRARGELSILAVISVCLEFYVGLTITNGIASGKASVHVSVSLFFFSVDETVTYETSFRLASDARSERMGDPAPPRWTPALWESYTSAFETGS